MRAFVRTCGILTALGLCALLATPAQAQEEFRFAGTWVGEFEEDTEPERDMATRGQRDRRISGDDRYECDGTWTLTFRGPNENLRGEGVVDQECRARRQGLRDIPPQPMEIRDIEFEDEGEGEKKKLEFELRLIDVKTEDAATLRCDAELEYKPDDDKIEGEYECRQTLRLRAAFDEDDRGTMALRIEGEFELRREGTDSDGGL